MKVEKKSSSIISGPWAKPGSNILNGDVITFLDAGQMDEEGAYGPKMVFKVKVPRDVEEKNLSLNQNSINNLVEAYGEETEDWVGKQAKAYVVKQMVGKEMKNVGYFVGRGFALDDNFKLVRTTTGPATTIKPKVQTVADDDIPTINVDDDKEIRIDDVPF